MDFQINWDLVLAWFLGNGLRAVVTLILAMIALKLAGTLANFLSATIAGILL